MGCADPIGNRTRELALSAAMPDGSPYLSLGIHAARELAAECGETLRAIEVAALGAGVIPERYIRNFSTLDCQGQVRLLCSKAVLIGLGGLGGLLLEAMVRMGVGTIEAADGDSFEESNLNRQLTSTTDIVDIPKTRAATVRAMTVNPAVDFLAHEVMVDESDMLAMCEDAHVVVDALGGLDDRPALQRVAARAGLPLVTAGIAGLSGYVATVMPGQPGPADFFGASTGAEDALGSPAPGVYTAASLQSAEIMRLLGTGTPALAGKMLLFDLRDMSFETIDIAS
ncbi:ThiF family adenylyltransferase [Desulfobaculum sp. SPO524]|uniref:ThiF family adenylyltransferase n=1 Tax=Desulfobaculum sp. SPO524 TaxID=3378071 RepID=UPI0038520D58